MAPRNECYCPTSPTTRGSVPETTSAYEPNNLQDPLREVISNAPKTSRLKSRKPVYKTENSSFDITTAWKEEWKQHKPKGGNIIEDPSVVPLPGFHTLSRKEWTSCNRIRARHGRTMVNQQRWGYASSPTCPSCNNAEQTMDHIILHCPATATPGGYELIHKADDDFQRWLADIDVEL